jgi:hypothetical protein
MTELDLTKLREIAKTATEGNWHWAGNTDIGEPYLATWIRGIGRCKILSIGSEDRSATGRKADGVRANAREFDLGDPEELVDQWAHDQFGEPVKDPRLQFTTDLMCVSARDLAVYEVAPLATTREDDRVYRADVSDIRHPDAAYIATFDPPTVLALIDEIEKLRRWKREAKQVLNGLGNLAKVADAPLGHPIIESAIDEIERLRGVIEKVRELAEDSEPQCCGPVLGDPLGEV